MLRRLKNIEDKTHNELDLIRDQGVRQLDRINRTNVNNTKAINFYDGPNKKLRNLLTRFKKETDDNAKKDKIFTVTISGDDFNFGSYTNLMNFGSNLFTKNLSLNEAESEQKHIFKMINDLGKKFRPEKIGHSLGKNNKKKAEELVENAKQLYKTRNDIIETFKELKTDESEESEESE